MNYQFKRVAVAAKFLSIYLLLALVLSGCRTYRDKALISAGTPSAVLIHQSPALSDFVIDNINGNPRPAGFISRYEIPVGPTAVVVGPNEGLYFGDKLKIQFEAKAGGVYRVDAKVKVFGGRWTAWITDQSTGKRFMGERVERPK